METLTPTFDLDALRDAVERDGLEALAHVLAEDVEFVEIDARTPPASPAVVRGRDTVLETARDIAARGLASRIRDGFVAGDRAALTIECRYPTGELVVENAICELRDGHIVRWSGVQAWDE
jgi:ketosteroid isomerase-like protein